MKRFLAFLMVLVMALPAAALADTAPRTLEFNMSGTDVQDAQNRLIHYGYLSGTANGIFDAAMLSAVKDFQKGNRLAVDGKIGPATRGKLFSDSAVAKADIGKPAPRTLQIGMNGEDVLAMQLRLEKYGFYTGALDSNFGSGMLTAVKQFQRKNGLKVDGKIGPATRAKLVSDSSLGKDDPDPHPGTLRKGMTGEAVKELQRQLRNAYYYAGKIDGIFGVEVQRAVKWFQESAGLTADGLAGSKTVDALYNRTAKIFNGGIPRRALASGDRGYDVYVLQQKLDTLNYLSITPSGYYGSDTVAAVKAFQRANGLKEDGKAGAIVRRYLWPTIVNNEEEKENQNQGTPDDPFTERTLRQGSYGKDVARAQMRLKAAGYLLDNADGIFGPKTKQAVRNLQADYKLKVDGIIGPSTWEVIKTFNVGNAEQDVVDPEKPSIGSQVTKLQKGSTGPAVVKLQQQLIQLHYLPAGQDDGKFGDRTARALKNFQRKEKLTVDGIAGSQTFVRLNEKLGTQWDVPVG